MARLARGEDGIGVRKSQRAPERPGVEGEQRENADDRSDDEGNCTPPRVDRQGSGDEREREVHADGQPGQAACRSRPLPHEQQRERGEPEKRGENVREEHRGKRKDQRPETDCGCDREAGSGRDAPSDQAREDQQAESRQHRAEEANLPERSTWQPQHRSGKACVQ